MKKQLQKRKDEPLHDWIDRLSKAYDLSVEVTEMVHGVAKEAYIVGSNAMYDMLKRDI